MSTLWGKAVSWYFEVSLEHDKLSQIPYFHLNIFKKENKAKPARERVFTVAIAFLVTLNRLEKQEMFLLLNHIVLVGKSVKYKRNKRLQDVLFEQNNPHEGGNSSSALSCH